MNTNVICPICGSNCPLLDVIDFNKSCSDTTGSFFGLSGIPIYYNLCDECHFCFAPEFANWQIQDFKDKIYNEEYILVDPSYVDDRPKNNARMIFNTFPEIGNKIKHLDFGGGDGLLSRILQESGWDSKSFDPFVDENLEVSSLGKFDIITSFEVFEHVPDVNELIKNLSSLLAHNGIIIFSTLVSDGNIIPCNRLNWWYASPRNGHISLFSKKSLGLLGEKEKFNFTSAPDGTHIFWKEIPSWAKHIFN